jgi:hypothetical protein
MSTRGPYTAEEMIFFYLLQGTEELLPYFQKKKEYRRVSFERGTDYRPQGTRNTLNV